MDELVPSQRPFLRFYSESEKIKSSIRDEATMILVYIVYIVYIVA